MANISVIVPVYKVEAYLERCIDSILGQSYQDFELILVDDGSPDNCGAMCDDYAEKNTRIHVIHQENGGLSAARNAGLEWVFQNSGSQWIAFIDSDDWIHKDYLKILIAAAEENGVPIAMCEEFSTDRFVQDAKYENYNIEILDPEQAYISYYCASVRACGKIVQKNMMKDLRFPVGKLFEDSFITHLLLFESERVAVTACKLYYYYLSPGSITRMKWSPKKMDEFEGHSIRLKYLMENGYRAAFKQEIEAFFQGGYYQLELLADAKKEHSDYKKYDVIIARKLRHLFFLGRKEGLFPLNFENIRKLIIISPIRWLHPMLQSVKIFIGRIKGVGSKSYENN